MAAQGSRLGSICVAGAVLALLAGCNKLSPGASDAMTWARTALERNPQIEVVASDPEDTTFTVRDKASGELFVVKADEIVASPPQLPATAAAPAVSRSAENSASEETAAAPVASASAVSSSAGDASYPAPTEIPANPVPKGGRVLAEGPGYSITASGPRSSSSQASANTVAPARTSAATAAVVRNLPVAEHRSEPLICQGERFLRIDNRNIEFTGDAVTAEGGCDLHITNSRITSGGVGIVARGARVHITNSQVEGASGSIEASNAAEVYAQSSTFKGMMRRLDTASLKDLGDNVWN